MTTRAMRSARRVQWANRREKRLACDTQRAACKAVCSAQTQLHVEPRAISLATHPRHDAEGRLTVAAGCRNATTLPAHHERGGKGLSGCVAGRLEGAEKRSGEVARAQRASSSDWPQLFERSGHGPRSEFCGPTLPRASQGSPAAGRATRMKPRHAPAQPPPRALPPKRPHGRSHRT